MSLSGFNASFGHSSEKKTNQYKKIFCAYHSTEFLTNFCIQKECLMPLCPTCVVEHTEQHYENNQKPTYLNLHDALQDSKQKCYSSIVQLQDFSRKNNQLAAYIQGLPEYIRRQLAECKEKLIRLIDQKFDAYEVSLLEQVRTKYAEDNVYSRKECEEVKQFVATEVQGLYDRIAQLKGEQCLSALIRYYESDQETLNSQIKEIGEYVQKNRRAGGLYISLNQEQTANILDSLCEKIVLLQYVPQEQSRVFSSNGGQDGPTPKKTPFPSRLSNRKDKSPLQNSQSFSSYKNNNNNYYNSPFRGGQF